MKSNSSVADADGVAVDDAGDAGQRRLVRLLGFVLGAPVTMIVAGLAIVVAPFIVEAAAVGVGGDREQNQECSKQERHYGTTETPQDIR